MRAEYGFPQALRTSVWRSGRKGRLVQAGRLCPDQKHSSRRPRGGSRFHGRSNFSVAWDITSNSSSYAGQAGCECSETSSISTASSCSSWLEARSALTAGSDDMRDSTSSSRSSLSPAADEKWEILIPFSNLSASSTCEPHDCSLLLASAAAGPEPRGRDGCPDSLEKRDRRERSFLKEKRSQCMQTAPSRTERACSSPMHIRHITCMSSGVKKRWHGWTHFLKFAVLELAIAAWLDHTLKQADSLKTRKRMTFFIGALLYSRAHLSWRHGLPPANVKFIVVFRLILQTPVMLKTFHKSTL